MVSQIKDDVLQKIQELDIKESEEGKMLMLAVRGLLKKSSLKLQFVGN